MVQFPRTICGPVTLLTPPLVRFSSIEKMWVQTVQHHARIALLPGRVITARQTKAAWSQRRYRPQARWTALLTRTVQTPFPRLYLWQAKRLVRTGYFHPHASRIIRILRPAPATAAIQRHAGKRLCLTRSALPPLTSPKYSQLLFYRANTRLYSQLRYRLTTRSAGMARHQKLCTRFGQGQIQHIIVLHQVGYALPHACIGAQDMRGIHGAPGLYRHA